MSCLRRACSRTSPPAAARARDDQEQLDPNCHRGWVVGRIDPANLQVNPKGSFDFSDDGSGGDIVSIDGEARFDEDGPRGKDHPAYLAKYGDWLKDYDWTPEYFSGLPAPGPDPPIRSAAGDAARAGAAGRVSAGVGAGVAAAGARRRVRSVAGSWAAPNGG